MRFVRDRLIFLGLVALDEACEACHTGPVEPSIPLRVVVTMLHALAGGDRQQFDEFLTALRMTPQEGRSWLTPFVGKERGPLSRASLASLVTK
jgi:hypothetical protein